MKKLKYGMSQSRVMKPLKFSVAKPAETEKQQKPNPKALIEAVSILEDKIEDLSKRAENLLTLIGSL